MNLNQELLKQAGAGGDVDPLTRQLLIRIDDVFDGLTSFSGKRRYDER